MKETIILTSIVAAVLVIGAVAAVFASWLLLSVVFVLVLTKIKESHEEADKKSKEDR